MFGVNVGTLTAHIRADDSEFDKTINRVERRLGRLATAFSRIGSKMSLAVTAPFAAMANASVQAFSDFNKTMTEAAAVTDGASKDMVRSMGDIAKALSTKTVFSANELGKAYVALGRAGNTASQAMERLPVVAKLAQAGVVDLEETVQLLTTSFAALGQASNMTGSNIGDFTRLANLLLEASLMSEGQVTDFALALTRKVGPALRFTNRDMTEGIALLATYAKMGMRGAFAAERIDILLRDLHRAQIRNASAWKMMGIETENTTRGVIPLVEVLRNLESSMKGMLPVQQRAMLQQLGFQNRSVQATIAVMGMTGVLELYEQRLRQTQNTLDEVSQKQMEAFANKMKTVGHQVNLLAISVGEVLAPKIESLAGMIDFLARAFEAIPGPLKALLITMGGIVAVFGPMLLLTGLFINLGRDTFRIIKEMVASYTTLVARQNASTDASLKYQAIKESELAALKRHTAELERNAAAHAKVAASQKRSVSGQFAKPIPGKNQLFREKDGELVPSSATQKLLDFEKVTRNATGSVVVFGEKAALVGKVIVDQYGNAIGAAIQGANEMNVATSSLILPLEKAAKQSQRFSLDETIKSWGTLGKTVSASAGQAGQQLSLWDNVGRAAATTNQRLVNSIVPLGKGWNDLTGASQHAKVSQEALNAVNMKTAMSSRILASAQTKLTTATGMASSAFTKFVAWLVGTTAASLTTTGAVLMLKAAISSLFRATIILGLIAAAFELVFWAASKLMAVLGPLVNKMFGIETSSDRMTRIMKEAGIETENFGMEATKAGRSIAQLQQEMDFLNSVGGNNSKAMNELSKEMETNTAQVDKNRKAVIHLIAERERLGQEGIWWNLGGTGNANEEEVKKLTQEIQRLIQENKNLMGVEEKKAEITAEQLEGAQKAATAILDLQDQLAVADPSLSDAGKAAAEFNIELRKLEESQALPGQIEQWVNLKKQLAQFEAADKLKELRADAERSLGSLRNEVELSDPALSSLERGLLQLQHRWEEAQKQFAGSGKLRELRHEFDMLADALRQGEHDKLIGSMTDALATAEKEINAINFPDLAESAADDVVLQAFKDQIDALDAQNIAVGNLRNEYTKLKIALESLREAKAIDKITKDIDSAFQSIRTPQEILDDSLAEIQKWRNELGNNITPDIEEKLRRLSEDAFEKFKESADKNLNLKDSMQMPDALQAGSAGAMQRLQDFARMFEEDIKAPADKALDMDKSKSQELIEQRRQMFGQGGGFGFKHDPTKVAENAADVAARMTGIDPHAEGAARVQSQMRGIDPYAEGAARVRDAMANRPPIEQKPLPPAMQQFKEDREDLTLQEGTNERLDILIDIFRQGGGAAF